MPKFNLEVQKTIGVTSTATLALDADNDAAARRLAQEMMNDDASGIVWSQSAADGATAHIVSCKTTS